MHAYDIDITAGCGVISVELKDLKAPPTPEVACLLDSAQLSFCRAVLAVQPSRMSNNLYILIMHACMHVHTKKLVLQTIYTSMQSS